MKLRRLWQPRRGLFWLMVTFNALSSLCSFGLQTLPLNTAGKLLLSCVALVNVAGGMWAAWMLVRDPPPTANGTIAGPARNEPP